MAITLLKVGKADSGTNELQMGVTRQPQMQEGVFSANGQRAVYQAPAPPNPIQAFFNSIGSTVALPSDLGHVAQANLFGSQLEKDTANNNFVNNWNGSIPGGVTNNLVHTAGTLGNMGQDAFYGAIGNQPEAVKARARAKQEFDQTVLADPFRLAVTAGSTLAQNDLLNKGYDPRTVLNAGNAVTDPSVGINSSDPNVTGKLINSAVSSAGLPLSVAGGSAILDALKGGVDLAKVASTASKAEKASVALKESTAPTTPAVQANVFKISNGEQQVPVRTSKPGDSFNYDVSQGAKAATQDPKLVNQVTKAALDTKSADPVTVMVEAMAKAKNKGEVRNMVESMNIPVQGNVKNRLVKALQNADTPQQVATAIRKHMDIQANKDSSRVRLIKNEAELTATSSELPSVSIKPKLKQASNSKTDFERYGTAYHDVNYYTHAYMDAVDAGDFDTVNNIRNRLAEVPTPSNGELEIRIKKLDAYANKVKNAKKTPTNDGGLLLNSKIKNTQDPVRKAELISERNAMLDNQAPKTPKITAPLEAKKSPNLLQRLTLPSRDWIAKHGVGGKVIGGKIREARNISEVGQEAFLEKVPSVLKLNKNDFTEFVDSLDSLSKGKALADAKPNVLKAIKEWQDAIPSIRDQAVKAGLDVGDLGPNYFPREYKDLVQGKNIDTIANELYRTGHAKDLNEALQQLEFAKTEYTRPYGHLEKNRLGDLPGYEKTHEALLNYVARSYDRIGKADQFGPKNEKLNELRAQVQGEGYNAAPGSNFDKQLKIALGDVDHNTTAHRFSGGVRQVNAHRSLSAAGISNSSQLVNTGTVGGVGRTVKAIVSHATSRAARRRAQQTGVLLDHTINDLSKQGLGVGGKISRNLASPFFAQVERYNRQVTAIVGEDWAKSLAKKAANGNKGAEDTLRTKLGVTGDIGAKLTREQEIQASRSMVEISQFKVDPQDLPGWVDSPMGKLTAQFRTFGYKQTGFVWNQVLREATKGNFLPLIRYVSLATPVGMGTTAAKNFIKAKQPDDNQTPLSTAFQGFLSAGGFGLPGSEANNIINGVQYDNLPGAVAGTLGGPTASIIAETATNASKAIGGNANPLIKEAIRNIPVIGPTTANLTMPSKQFTPGKTDPSTLTPDDLKKYEGATYSDFQKGLSDGDKKIFGLQQNTDAANIALRKGTVTQDQLDDMQAKYNRAKMAAGLPITYIQSITPEQFNKFDKQTQSLITEASLIGAKKFGEKTTVDKTATATIDEAKKNQWPNTGDIKATNKLALDYVATLKKMQDVPDDQGQQYELYKGFWKGAVKDEYSKTVTAGYGSSIGDLRRLSAGVSINGTTYSVKREDLDKMVELDDRMLKAGLIDKPKFTDKVREEAGYDPAPASLTDGVGYVPKESKASGGKGKSFNPSSYAISSNSGSASAKVKQPSLKSTRVSFVSKRNTISKPKVSLKKAK